MRKHLTVILFGTQYWDDVMDLDALVRYGTIDAGDLKLFHRTDSVDEAYDIVTRELTQYALAERGAIL